MAETKQVTYEEYRGCSDLVYALITEDSLKAYATGEVKPLSGMASITKTTAQASATKSYDNGPKIVINAEGEDTLTFDVSVLSLETLADLTGKDFDATTGAFNDSSAIPPYVAIGYKTNLTDGSTRYVWRLKCTVSIPDDASKVKDSSTDASGQKLTVTGIETTYKFKKKGKSRKACVIDERDSKVDLSTFFSTVTTEDTLLPKAGA